jgi:predicted  nucleic acid-binding Zn-ribbon protein
MSALIESLLRLQDRDQRLAALRKELESLPQERLARESRVAHLEKAREAARQRSREIEVERKALEVEVQGLQERIARYKTQQMQTRKNEEYSALSHEIAGAENQISGLEDRELALMEEADALQPASVRADAEFVAGKEEVARQLAGLEKKEQNLTVELGELVEGRKSLLEGLDEDLVDRYERLFRSKGGLAVVALEGNICTGCHMSVTAQTMVEVKSDLGLTSCPQCGRVLYLS